MNPILRLRFTPGRYRVLAALAGLLLAGCRHNVVVVPAYDDYFPVVVGTYRTYAVTDSTWQRGVLSVSNYQFRERVDGQFTDATGQPAYRLVRSKRPNSSASWADDSALVVQPLPRAVLVTRNNVRTVDLIYPPQANKGWNDKAFTASPDTITTLNRYYGPNVAAPYTTPAAGGHAATTYPTTVTTKTTLPGGVDDVNALYQRGLRQVYASGTGLVQRRRFSHNTYYTLNNGATTLTPGVVQDGYSRFEVLIETGTL